MRRIAHVLGLITSIGLTVALSADIAYAQGTHSHGGGISLTRQELLAGIAHSATLMATVLLAGLAAFMVLVLLPVSRASGVGREAGRLFIAVVRALFGLLVIAGLAEVSLYAVRASGESLSLALFGQAWFETRVGHIWLARLAFAFVTVLVATWAAREEKATEWWAAAGLGSVLLLTLTQLSHAAAEGRFLPFLADWLHVIAASVWMGGLLGFPMLLLGPLGTMPAETRSELLTRTVRRFSKVASIAVMTILVTGTYAILLHVPSFSALLTTTYGRALVMKLGLVAFMFPIATINLVDRGKGPFERMVGAELLLAFGVFVATGFLTSLPPPGG